MQIHRPLAGITLATRMLDIDLPRICITSSSGDNYNPSPKSRTSSAPTKTHHYALVPAVVRSRSPSISPAGSRRSSRDFRVPLLPQPVPCAVEHSRELSRSRSPSFNRNKTPSPRTTPVKVPLPQSMAVLSAVKKSPSTQLKVEPVYPQNRYRSASFGRESEMSPATNGRRSPSPGPPRSRAGSSTSLTKSVSPVVPRRMPASRSIQSNISSKTACDSSNCAAAGPSSRRKSPVIGNNRSLRASVSPSNVSRRASLTSSITNSSEHDQHKVKYERNLKKFYSWCQHCKRVQKAAQQIVAPVKGLLTGNIASKRSGNNPVLTRTGTTPTTASAHKQAFAKKHHFGLYSFDSSELPLSGPQNNAMGLLQSGSKMPGDDEKNRPKSANVPPGGKSAEKPKFVSLFNFDDALSLTAEPGEHSWMDDLLDDDEDFCFNLDVETMSICSDTSIRASAITCDTKLKDDDEDYGKTPLRKAYSSNK